MRSLQGKTSTFTTGISMCLQASTVTVVFIKGVKHGSDILTKNPDRELHLKHSRWSMSKKLFFDLKEY